MRYSWNSNSMLSVAAFAAIALATANAANAGPTERIVDLGGTGFDMAYDDARQQLYVSIPDNDELVVVSTTSWEVADRLFVGQQPHGIDLSIDGAQLFIALNQSGAFTILDLDTGAQTEVVIAQQLDTPHAYDIIEAIENRVFVSGNPGSGGFAYIVMVKLDEGNAAERVASNNIIRADPIFEVSPDRNFLYVGEGFSPNSLYKLDLSQSNAPIVLEDDHGSVSGTDHLEASPDGGRIYLRSGQALRTADFTQAGVIDSGISQFDGVDDSVIYVAQTPDVVAIFDTATFQEVGAMNAPCAFSSIRQLMFLPDGAGWLILGDGRVCGITEEGGLALNVTGECPDGVTVHVSGAEPGARVHVIYGLQEGDGPIVPGCPDVRVGLLNPTIAGSLDANANGEVIVTRPVPPAACGRVLLQAVIASPSCAVSNVALIP